MQKVNSHKSKWWDVVFFFTASLVVIADQLSKLGIRANLALGESLFEVGFFRLTYVRGSGAAFGLFQDQTSALIIVALVGVAIMLYAFFFRHKFPFLDNRRGKLALSLVVGGTVGNLIDRIYLGYVTDFISIGIWPVFNIADSAIVVGVIILAYLLLRGEVNKQSL